MKEEAVFWLGAKPGTLKAASAPPDAAGLEPAILAACRAQGIEPENFVAALGGYGSWLVHFERNAGRERVVWNGRDRKLVLQAALRSGGWEDRQDCPVTSVDENGFVTALGALLTATSGPAT